jgi:hypothetical protein
MRRLYRRIIRKRKKPRFPTTFVSSPEWLSTPEHKRWAHDVMKASKGRCDLCGRKAGDISPDGKPTILNADHIKPRITHPHLALEVSNGQCLCAFDNEGKGNRDDTNWRIH